MNLTERSEEIPLYQGADYKCQPRDLAITAYNHGLLHSLQPLVQCSKSMFAKRMAVALLEIDF